MNSDVEVTNQTAGFLHDFYPGMKEMPNEFVQLMASPHPEKTINIKANIEEETDAEREYSAMPKQTGTIFITQFVY